MNYIKYKKQQLPIQIDFAVIKIVCAKINIKLSEFEKLVYEPSSLEVVFFEALKRGAKLSGTELLVKESECEDVLSECFGDFLVIFTESVLKMFTQTVNGSKKN